jgi:predicted lipoprotein with Yx(FWY)xxD motif
VTILTRLKPANHWRLALSGLALAMSLGLAGYGGMFMSPSSVAAATTTVSKVKLASLTVKTASVAKLGKVLVNGKGRTLYTLTSERSGKITCTTASGCTMYWSEVDSAKGRHRSIKGAARAAMVRTERGASGKRLLTYHGWPLYTYSGDSAKGQANGEGLKSFGGTWYALSASGSLVKPAAKAPAPTSSSGVPGY